jgi:hypothetical protein
VGKDDQGCPLEDGQLQVHQLQRLLHALDVLAAQPHQVAALTDVVTQGLRGLVGLEDTGQHAELVQPLNPLAVAAVGLGPAPATDAAVWPSSIICTASRRNSSVYTRRLDGAAASGFDALLPIARLPSGLPV